jgi:hypothetical protein
MRETLLLSCYGEAESNRIGLALEPYERMPEEK